MQHKEYESIKTLIEAGWVFESVMVYHHHFGSSQAEHGRLGCMMPAAIWLWMGLLRETQAGANLQKTLPACLRMEMTSSSILWLCVRALTHSQKLHVLHKSTVRQVCLQGHCSLKQIVVLNGKIEINRISIINSRHGFNLCIALSSCWIWAILQMSKHYAQFVQRNV